MEAIAMLRSSSLPKLPLYAPSSSTIPSMTPCLRFDLRKPFSSSWLLSGSTGVSIGLAWNLDVHDKFLAHCGNGDADFFPLGAKDPLKSLLSLGPKEAMNCPNGNDEVESPLSSIARIKNEALKLVVSGECKAAENLARGLCVREEGNPEEAYEAQMALVQVLIHLEKYEEALHCLDKEHGFISSDGKPLLYKAIVYTMLGKHENAKTWWNNYINIIGKGLLD